jgi:hypothetical protein
MGVLLADIFINNDRLDSELVQLSRWTKALYQRFSKTSKI